MNSLPTPAQRLRVGSRRYKFLRRLLNVKQMDFELALWEMLNLCIGMYSCRHHPFSLVLALCD